MAKAKTAKVVDPIEAAPVEEKAPKFTARTVKCDGFVSLNVRPMPEFGGKPLRTVPNGAKVMARPEVDGWCELKDGGFVKAEYLG
jgi:hypothetical protein